MRICYLANTAIPSSNASAIQIVKMCEAFSELKNEVILITTNVLKTNENLFKYYDIKSKFIFKRIENFKTFPLGIKYYLFTIFSIIKSLKYNPEIYITRNFFSCFLLVLLKKKVIIELHHDINSESRIVKFLVKYTNYLNSKHIKKIIAITKSVKKEFIDKYSVNEKKFLLSPSGSAIKNKFEFINNKKKFFKIGYFGSLYKSRGLDLMIKLAKLDQNNSYYLFGDLKKNYLTKYKYYFKNLIFNNYVPYKDVPKNLLKMDILIMPYVSKITVAGDVGDITNFTSPLKLFDYLSAGKIIICSDFKVLKEVIKDKKNAIFIKNFKNPYAWKTEIDKLKNQPQKVRIISKNNYDLSKKYSLKDRAKEILKKI